MWGFTHIFFLYLCIIHEKNIMEIKYENKAWYVHKSRIRTDYPVIENLKQFLAPSPPILPKFHPKYIEYWSRETKKCIEGIWRKEFGKWRYMPGNLYYFGSFTVLEHTEEKDGVKETKHFKPLIVDYYWEFAAQSWAAYGFSGFTKDDEFTCNLKVSLYEEGKFDKENLPKSCIKENGDVKTYVNPFNYLLKLHDKPLGKSLFQNEAEDTITFGTRGGGKSYWVGLGELEYNYIFNGAKRYNQDFIDGKYSSRQLVGSADTTKSSELYDKFEKSQAAKVDNTNADYVKWFGIYTEKYIDEKGNTKEKVIPCPFYKRSLGSLVCPNKKNPYRSKYKAKKNGEWEEEGTGSELVHVNYSSKKSDGFTAGVGGRYLFSDIEEVGLVENVIAVRGANDSATRRSGLKMGVQHCQGTSGSIEHVQEAKKLFLNPQDYGIMGYKNAFSEQGSEGKIGYFIPNYMVHFDCKDENGNTDYDRVLAKINRTRIEKSKSKDPKVLRDFIMNEPCYVPEMWLTDKGYYLPYDEASERERELMKNQLFRIIGKPVKLIWESQNTVRYDILHDANPINQWPLPKDLKDPSGCIVIYEFPEEGPNDLYLFCHDPYIEENLDGGGSLGVTYVLKNPKYIPQGRTGNIVVASYIGKPAQGLEYYYEQQEKLLAFYGNPMYGLWYEKNRGEICREYYIRKGKQYLLAPTPQYMQGSSIYQKNITSFGVVVGNKLAKLNMLKVAHDWLLETTEFSVKGDTELKKNIFRIPCKYLIDQIMQFNMDDNFDGVSAFIVGTLAFREIQAIEEQELLQNEEINIFENILKNTRIFNKNRIESKPYKDKDLVSNPK